MFSNFWMTEVLKELVITVGNEPTLINTSFHCEIIWVKMWYPRGTILKNQINLLMTPTQAIGLKIPVSKIISRILRKSDKNDEFLKETKIGNLVCIKTCYSFKPIKTHRWPKTQAPRPWYLEIIFDALGHVDQITHFSKILLSHNPLFGQKW